MSLLVFCLIWSSSFALHFELPFDSRESGSGDLSESGSYHEDDSTTPTQIVTTNFPTSTEEPTTGAGYDEPNGSGDLSGSYDEETTGAPTTLQSDTDKHKCQNSQQCSKNARCMSNDNGIKTCMCDKEHAEDDNGFCTYERKLKKNALAASLIGGILGADWFYLSCGDGAYIVAGIFKLFFGVGIPVTCYCFTKIYSSKYPPERNWNVIVSAIGMISFAIWILWWFIDWTRMAGGSCGFKDGNGYCLG